MCLSAGRNFPAGIFSPRCVLTRRLENYTCTCNLTNSLKTRKRQTLEQDKCSCTPPNFCRAECLRCCLDVHVVVAFGGPSALISSLERSYMPLEPSIRSSNGAVKAANSVESNCGTVVTSVASSMSFAVARRSAWMLVATRLAVSWSQDATMVTIQPRPSGDGRISIVRPS